MTKEQTLWLGAVAYDAKVVPIWEGMRRYFHEEAKLDVEVVLFQSYECQNAALLGRGPKIDIAWHTNLAYVQAQRWSGGACKPVAMRDADIGWTSLLIAPKGGSVTSVASLRGKKLALGSRDSGHAAILPVHFLREQGMTEGSDFTALRFNTDLGKHGDTGTSEVDVLKAVLDGRADAGMVGSPFWSGVNEKKLVPAGAVEVVWTSPPYNHCMFTARADFPAERVEAFRKALFGMSWDNPVHRPVLEAEGLKRWLAPASDGYDALIAACDAQGFFADSARR